MEHFSALHLFISVADTGSFSAGGEALGISTSVVSRQIAALETELGTRLFKRSTRRVELTDAGAIYLKRIRSLLTELEETNRALKKPNSTAAGRFRIVTSTAIGLSLIVPAIADFMAANPGVAIHLDLLDRVIDPQEEDYDLVLQVGDNPNVAGPVVVQIEMGLFGSPAYLAHHGRPRAPADLDNHRALYLASQQNWNLRGNSGEKPKMQFCSNRFEALKALCLAGQGIALLPLFLVRAEIERGDLVQLLDGFEPKPSSLFVANSSLRSETMVSRLFQSFLESRFKRLRF